MDLSAAEIIGRVIGPLYVVAGLGMLINPAAYRRMGQAFMDQPGLTYLGGATALAMGLLVLAVHYDFSALYPGAITLLAWIAVFKGAALLLAPQLVMKTWAPVMTSIAGLRAGGVFALALGAYFAAKGYRLI
ncbi:MAG: hypothetical protein OEO83_07080 [Alphaproteobacteria bacterium]|nr:hypothetical protein [Alphaproteobacteria bacterium]